MGSERESCLDGFASLHAIPETRDASGVMVLVVVLSPLDGLWMMNCPLSSQSGHKFFSQRSRRPLRPGSFFPSFLINNHPDDSQPFPPPLIPSNGPPMFSKLSLIVRLEFLFFFFIPQPLQPR